MNSSRKMSQAFATILNQSEYSITGDSTPLEAPRTSRASSQKPQRIIYQGLLDYDDKFLGLSKELKAKIPI